MEVTKLIINWRQKKSQIEVFIVTFKQYIKIKLNKLNKYKLIYITLLL